MSRRLPGALVVVAAGALLTAGCTGGHAAPGAAPSAAATAASPGRSVAPGRSATRPPSATASPGVFDDAAVTVARLGKVAIPTPGPTGVQPLATRNHLQLVAMGETVVARPATGTELALAATGPDLRIAPGPVTANASAPGTITVTVKVTHGSVRLRPTDFVARDIFTRVTKLRTDAGAVVVRAGQTRSLTFSGTFINGGAVFEWTPAGHRMVVWDFHVELD